MIRKILEECPSCGGQLEIGEVHCTACDTRVHARYRPCEFCALTEEQSTFLRLFVVSRGNLTEVEKRLGVSYPTVRAKLDEVIERLTVAESTLPRPQASPPGTGRRAGGARVGGTGASADADEASASPPRTMQTERRRILAAVARGEISAEDGMNIIRSLGVSHADEGRGTEDGST
jgi:hypothetical protein